MPLDRAGKKYSPKFNPVWARVNKKVIIFRNTESDSSCNHRRTGAILSPVCCHLEHRSRAQEFVAARAIEEAEVIDKSEAACVPSAWPGADNRIRLTDQTGIDFFEMLEKIVEHEFDVYPVGDLKV